jgi:hypothetical protein
MQENKPKVTVDKIIMIHIFVNNFFCVACIIFALTIFKGNDLLQNLIVCKSA